MRRILGLCLSALVAVDLLILLLAWFAVLDVFTLTGLSFDWSVKAGMPASVAIILIAERVDDLSVKEKLSMVLLGFMGVSFTFMFFRVLV